jgi:glycine cleavage system H protein
VKNPHDLLYAETHEWTKVAPHESGGKVATVGITAFAVEALTDLVYMQLPEVGQKVEAGKPFGEIESVKAVSDLYSPVDGEIVAVNSKLPENLELLNQDPYGKGWMLQIKIADESGLKKLKDAKSYEKQCAEEAH